MSLIGCFEELIEVVKLEDNKVSSYKIRTYSQIVKALRELEHPVTNVKDCLKVFRRQGMKYTGEESYFRKNRFWKSSSLMKIEEYLEMGTFEVLKKRQKDEKKEDKIKELSSVFGIGIKIAENLYSEGFKTLDDLRKNPQLLTQTQLIGLTYHSDMQKRITREEMEEWKSQFDKFFEKIADEQTTRYLNYDLAGSFRRMKQTSGDIDLLIISDQGFKIMKKLIEKLQEYEIIILSSGNKKTMAIIKNKENVYRRIDIFYTTRKRYPFSILFLTGSGEFNISMRRKAKERGYTLNEYGITRSGIPINKMEIQKSIGKSCIESERDIFDFFQIEYYPPEDRK